jgi:predicted lipoprotein with Yx(FWY)xxD motif
MSAQPGLAGEFGVTERTDGTMQVTHDGQPLYYFIGDAELGMTNGQGIGDVWYVDDEATVATSENEELGTILIGANGMTLYLFTNDTDGQSACVDTCVNNWPPLIVAADEPINLAEGLEGDVATIERADGSLQVSFNGMPLYYFARDVLPGDTNGQGRGDVWYVVNP